jgi:FkbM family methyltransferase
VARPAGSTFEETSMSHPRRPIAFVLAASDYGPLIVNRFDRYIREDGSGIGVGLEILGTSTYASEEVAFVTGLLGVRRRHFGDGVLAIDCGANIGVHTIEWATTMTGWGSVIAIEAQERIFYALAGNISINNCFNARAIHAAVGKDSGVIKIPNPDYLKPSSFGSLELKQRATTEYIGQDIDYSDEATSPVRCMTLDSLGANRVDLLKIDVEGMEIETLAGAEVLIKSFSPIIIVEWIKSPREELKNILTRFNYAHFELGVNLVAIHNSDPTLGDVKFAPVTTA